MFEVIKRFNKYLNVSNTKYLNVSGLEQRSKNFCSKLARQHLQKNHNHRFHNLSWRRVRNWRMSEEWWDGV